MLKHCCLYMAEGFHKIQLAIRKLRAVRDKMRRDLICKTELHRKKSFLKKKTFRISYCFQLILNMTVRLLCLASLNYVYIKSV